MKSKMKKGLTGISLLVLASMSASAYAQTEIKFLTWNVWHGSEDKQLAKDITALAPDIMTLQETYSRQAVIRTAFAKAHGISEDKVYEYTVSCFKNAEFKFTGEQGSCFPGKFEVGSGRGSADNLTIWSRFPIVDYNILDNKDSTIDRETINRFNYGSVKLDVDGQPLWVSNFWLSSTSGAEVNLSRLYADQKNNHVLGHPTAFDKEAKIKEIVAQENERRVPQANQLVKQMKNMLNKADDVPVILAGDANSFSHLDWDKKWSDAHFGIAIDFPVSKVFQQAGLIDSYREVRPNPVTYPCSTWQPQVVNPPKARTWAPVEPSMDAPGRIDYIYYKGSKLSVKDSVCLSNPAGGVSGTTSDHGAVMTTFILN